MNLYEKCSFCHLFVELNEDSDPDIAGFIHLTRGDDADDLIESTHDAQPSGMRATLDTWKTYGPIEMRERFYTWER